MYAKVKEYYIDLRKEVPVFRSVLAVSFALIYATTIGYPIAHTTAIFAMMFIGPGKGPIKFTHILIYPIALYIIGLIAVYIGYVLIDHIGVTLLVIGLCIFWSFRLIKIPNPVRLLFLIFTILLPLQSISANGLGEATLVILIVNLAIGLIIVKFSFLLIPLTFAERQRQLTPQNTGKAQTGIQFNNDKMALNGLVVIFPIMAYYYFSNDPDILILVFVALLAFDPMIAQSKKGLIMLLSNVLGGVVGIVAYQILVIAPNYLLYLFLCISICFYFVINIYAGKKTSPIYSTSFNTFFIVMGTIATSTDSAGTKVWDRILQIGIALVYTIVAYKLVNLFNNPIKSEN